MPTFDYRADDAQGRRCKGRLEADSPRHARQLLRERGLWPRDVQRNPRCGRHRYSP
jgi:general secretion pathway protein F